MYSYFSELSDLIVTLCSTGLYATALHLCDEFKVSKASVLKSLTSQCIKLSQREDPNAWDWLIQNDIFGMHSYYNFYKMWNDIFSKGLVTVNIFLQILEYLIQLLRTPLGDC